MAEPLDPTPLVGTWKLMSTTRFDRDGRPEAADAGWDRPSGFLMYTADGRMMALLASGDRPALGYPDIDDQDRIAAHKAIGGYSGTYDYYGDHVLHHVELAIIPDWQGADQHREVHLEGNRLTLTTPFGRRPDGSMSRFELVWERVSPANE